MWEYILFVFFIVLLVANIVVNVWSVKMNCNEQRLKSVAIYKLYLEIKKFNDRHDET